MWELWKSKMGTHLSKGPSFKPILEVMYIFKMKRVQVYVKNLNLRGLTLYLMFYHNQTKNYANFKL